MIKNKHYLQITVTLIVGVLFAILLFFSLEKWEKSGDTLTFQHNAQGAVHAVEKQLADLTQGIYSFADFLELIEPISEAKFQQYAARYLSRNSQVELTSWHPYIQAHQRELFEKEQLAGNYILRWQSEGVLGRDIDRGFYFPSLYQASWYNLSKFKGYNLTSDVKFQDDVKKALASAQIVSSNVTSLAGIKPDLIGMLLIVPVYDENARAGVLIQAIDIKAISQLVSNEAKSAGLDVWVYEQEVPEAALPLFAITADDHQQDMIEQAVVEQHPLMWRGEMQVVDKQWRVVIAPSEHQGFEPYKSVAWMGFVFVLVVWAGFCFFWLKRYHYTKELLSSANQHEVANEHLANEIVERLKIEESLVKFAHAFQLSADGINLIDMDGNYTYCNAASENLYGYRSEQMSILHFLDINQDPEVQNLDLLSFVEKQGSWLGQLSQTRADGTIFFASVSLSLIKDDSHKAIGFLEITRDITENTLLQTELQQSRKMEALGTLAGGIAHDFNNILASILGNTEMMVITKVDPVKAENYIANIQESCNRAANLVKQIMTFSRMDSLKLVPIDLINTVKDALNIIRVSIPSSISIVTSIDSHCPPIKGDATQIHQIVMNLCNNAAQAIGDEAGTIAIDLHPVKTMSIDKQHVSIEQVQLTITDTGQGISKEHLERIFDPFYTTKRLGEGTGLGLSVVKSIIESHGGEIQVRSEEQQGASFIIVFPTCEVHTEAIPIEPKIEEVFEHQDIEANQSKHVLIAEDEKHISKLYQEFLQDYGYQTTVCSDGAEALKAFNDPNNSFDLVLTDQAMPHVTGKELSILMLQKQPDLPIIMCTGYSEVISEEVAKDIGIKHYLLKPASLSKLMAMINDLLKD